MGGKAADPNKAAREAQRDKMKRMELIDTPELEEYVLQNPELVGLLDAEQLGQSAMGDISTDPRLKEQQMQALSGMQERADQGLTAQDKFAMEEMMGQVGAQEKSQRAAIESEMARKGMGDSGASLMAKLQGSQGGANSARQKAMQMAAQGQQQRMAALQGMGQMAGQMEGADFQRQSQQASAKDAIAKANAMNRQNVNAMNLSARQQNENSRANIANQQSQVRNQLNQQQFNNQMAKAGSQNSISAGPAGPQKPSAMQGALAGGSAGASFGPWGAAIGAGAGALATQMEDGGIAKAQAQESKQHEKFKSDYMKRVRGELVPQKEAREEVTGLENGGVAFGDAFKQARSQQGDGGSFDWQGKQYTTDLAKEPVSEMPVELREGFGAAEKNPFFDQGKMQQDMKKAIAGEEVKDIALLGQGNDKTSADIQTNEQAQELIKGDDSGMSGANIAKGLKAANQLMGALEPKQGEAFEDTFKLEKAENVMTPVQSQQFGNAFQGAQFEDGGVSPISEMARMRQPTYECGGIHSGTKQAEDGDLMFDSEGEGAVVGGDSFERDRVDARLNSGEAVLNVAQQQRLMDILRGEESVDSLGEDDIVEGVPSGYQEELTEEIDNGEDMKVSGLKKLLSALGE
jgi:hypothetical protein